MARLRLASQVGTLSVALTNSGTTITSAALAEMPAVTGSDYAAIILDPNYENGALKPEIAYITAHTAAATTATITRGNETATGTSAGRAHNLGVTWHHGPTLLDYATALTIGVDVQAWDAQLDILAATNTAFGLSLVNAANALALRVLAGTVIGVDVQAWDADLDAWAAKTAPSGTVVGSTDTQTLSNKRVTKRVTAIASSATPAVNSDAADFVDITALAAAANMSTSLTGTPSNGQQIVYRIKDNGTARAITWGAGFEAMGVALPTTTVISKRLLVGFVYDSTTSKFGCVASNQEA